MKKEINRSFIEKGKPKFIVSKELNELSRKTLFPEKVRQAEEIINRLMKEDPEGWKKFKEDK